MPQVDKKIYNFRDYVLKERWISYWHQINEVMNSKKPGAKVLLIGAGDRIVPDILRGVDIMLQLWTLIKSWSLI